MVRTHESDHLVRIMIYYILLIKTTNVVFFKLVKQVVIPTDRTQSDQLYGVL